MLNHLPTYVRTDALNSLNPKRRAARRPVRPEGLPAEVTLRQFARRLIVAQEEERKRIARELHDDVSQRMAQLSIELDQLGNDPVCTGELSNRCRKLHDRIDELSVDIHRLSHRLHPSRLEHLGLDVAIQGLCRELSEGAALKIRFNRTGFPTTLPDDVKLCVFRIAQEALRNCVKYSGATIVRVKLLSMTGALRLSVTDNGCGFEPEAAAAIGGLGFVSMRERVELVGGAVDIHSRPGCGTRIEVFIPVSRASMRVQERGSPTCQPSSMVALQRSREEFESLSY